ncbi:outer membrane protein assembly factor BamB [Pseudonocardia hierapolitana]|uniref:Outer membrane protein assembly factor BamB n=2 Tax=Pseudonocardia hierapolitana TaxID=1128676 RepID=A0A561SPL6_9PSEU|nr:outer membrane protein assembly factor BamB [Pseudonocardia hierapolitana]
MGRGASRRTVLVTALGGGVAAVAGAIGLAALSASRPPSAPRVPHLRWSAPFGEADEPVGAWAADDTTLYACRDQDVVRALDGATGAVRWTAATHAWYVVPSDGVLVFAHAEAVGALDAATGRPVWEMRRASSVNHAIDVSHGTVVAVAQEGVPTDPLGFPMKVVALDAATGARLWTSEQYEFVGTLRVGAGAGAAYYCQDERLVAREIRTGAVRWTAPVIGINAEVLGATEDFVVVRDNGLVVIDAATGRRCWGANWQVSSVAFAGGLLVAQTMVGTSRARLSAVHGVDPASGTLVWTVLPSGEPASPAVSTDGFVYLSVRDGATSAYGAATGELLWRHDAGTPVAARGRDVYLLAGGELHALTGP